MHWLGPEVITLESLAFTWVVPIVSQHEHACFTRSFLVCFSLHAKTLQLTRHSHGQRDTRALGPNTFRFCLCLKTRVVHLSVIVIEHTRVPQHDMTEPTTERMNFPQWDGDPSWRDYQHPPVQKQARILKSTGQLQRDQLVA